MDRSRKRKAVARASPESEGNASKRAKLPGPQQQQDSETATKVGLHFIEQLKAAKDKTGRPISDLFRSLPDKDELPEYYAAIKLPISIETIENKLRRNEYATLSQVEGDLKRMVANAKQFNEDTSIVYADAERIRKMVSNFMTKNNPAYKAPGGYVAFPTPIPGDDKADPVQVQGTPKPSKRDVVQVQDTPKSSKRDVAQAQDTPKPSKRDASEQPRKPTVTLSLKGRKSSVAATAAAGAAPSPGPVEDVSDNTPAPTGDFTGKTFQQAQEQIIYEVINHTVDNFAIFSPFVSLPPRSLTDYYHVIKKPVSLSAVKKRTKGIRGREKPTGITDFKTWDAFEDEVSYIWNNAREYNEDGSDMFNLAGELEAYFKERLSIAKQQVEEPQQPKITLKGRPKTVLHLGSKASPAPSTPGGPVDKDPLARQKQTTNAAVNKSHSPAPPKKQSATPSRPLSQAPVAAPAEPTKSAQAASSPPLPASAVKSEKPTAPSPSLAVPRPQTSAPEDRPRPQPATSMPPPAPRPTNPPVQTNHVPLYVPAPSTFVDQYSRTKPVADALMPNLTIATPPQMNLPKPFKLEIPPSSKFTQQSLTVTLPSTHYYIQITPTVAPHLLSARQYKLFVTVNGVRLMASNKPFLDSSEMNGVSGGVKQVYETSLLHGVNRIEVEIVAATGGRGGPLEMEKVNVFANLMRP